MADRPVPLSVTAGSLLGELFAGSDQRGAWELLAEVLAGQRTAVDAEMEVDSAELLVAVRERVERGEVGEMWDRQQLTARAGARAAGQGRPVAHPGDVAEVLLDAGLELLAAPAAEEPASMPQEPVAPGGISPAVMRPKPAAERQAVVTSEAVVSPSAAGEAVPRSGGAGASSAATPPAPAVVDRGGRVPVFRVFVSSTFEDLRAERDALAELAWPRLREFCAVRGARFQAIDLRWGVSEEAGLDQQAMNVCIDEVRRCHEVTPRPNFLVLVGNRYGWRPLPAEIPDEEYGRLQGSVSEDEAAELAEWYELDRNAEPPEFRLAPRTGCYTALQEWEAREERLRAILDRAVAAVQSGPDAQRLGEDRLLVYRASATEQEIREGALSPFTSGQNALWVLRELVGEPAPQQAATFHASYWDRDQALVERLRGELRDRLGEPVGSYQVAWDPAQGEQGAPSTDHVAQLAEEVAAALQRAIERELEHPSQPLAVTGVARPVPADRWLDDEGEEHRRFAERRVQEFVGRDGQLAEVDRYLAGDTAQPLVVFGSGGCGKSAFVAEVVRRVRSADRDVGLVYRFVGATPGSSDGRSLLYGVCRELARRSGEDDTAVPSDFNDLVKELHERLAAGTPQWPLVVVLDSLDQLSEADGGRSLSWLLARLPPHARLVVSTRDRDADGHPLDTYRALQGRCESLALPALPLADGQRLLEAWLKRAGRTLQRDQQAAVLDAFTASAPDDPDAATAAAGLPLYLELAFEEASRWPSGDGRPPVELARGIEPLIRDNLFQRLAARDRHGRLLVSRALGYLAASRYGLAEDELLDLLARDLELYRWFLTGSHHLPPDLVTLAVDHLANRESGPPGDQHSTPAANGPADAATRQAAAHWLEQLRTHPSEELDRFLTAVVARPDGPQLPVVLWSRLGFDLRPYLTERRSEAGPLLGFYHRELQDAAVAAFVTGRPATAADHLAPLAVRLAAYDPAALTATVEVWAMTLVGVGDAGGAVFTTSTVELVAHPNGDTWLVVSLDTIEGPTPLVYDHPTAPGRTRSLVRDATPLLPLPLPDVTGDLAGKT
jgi:hypothetical protein